MNQLLLRSVNPYHKIIPQTRLPRLVLQLLVLGHRSQIILVITLQRRITEQLRSLSGSPYQTTSQREAEKHLHSRSASPRLPQMIKLLLPSHLVSHYQLALRTRLIASQLLFSHLANNHQTTLRRMSRQRKTTPLLSSRLVNHQIMLLTTSHLLRTSQLLFFPLASHRQVVL